MCFISNILLWEVSYVTYINFKTNKKYLIILRFFLPSKKNSIKNQKLLEKRLA